MSMPILVVLLAAFVITLLVVRARQSPRRAARPVGPRRSGKSSARPGRRRPEVPYVSASLRGMTGESDGKPRRTSGLG